MRSYIKKNKTCRLVTGSFFFYLSAPPLLLHLLLWWKSLHFQKSLGLEKQTYISFDDTCGASEKADLLGLFLTDHSES